MNRWRRVAESISIRTGVKFQAAANNTLNNGFSLVPDGLVSGHGFSVFLEADWRHIKARFVPDNFAADLIAAMATASFEQREVFNALHRIILERRAAVVFQINDRMFVPEDGVYWVDEPWRKVELSIESPFVVFQKGTDDELELMSEWGTLAASIALSLLPLKIEHESEFVPLYGLEGAAYETTTVRYERNPLLKTACLMEKGESCNVCGFNFEQIYGAIGAKYIQVHHITPISAFKGIEHPVDVNKDLIPVCANCHAMLHKKIPPYSPEELKALLDDSFKEKK